MKKIKNILIALSLGALALPSCKSLFQYSEPEVVTVNSIEEVSEYAQPVFLQAGSLSGKYYMEVELTSDIPEFGWIVVDSETIVPYVMPAYPNKPAFASESDIAIIGVAKEPAYKVVGD